MQKYLTKSDEETKRLAAKIAKEHKGKIFALTGELGAGKTTFVQGFAKGLGIKEKIISPTFVLIREHKIPKSKYILYHVDLYRLENIDDLRKLGLEEILSNPNNIVLIEWAEKVISILPKDTVKISLDIVNPNTRKITINSLF